jgi:uncharacterized protein
VSKIDDELQFHLDMLARELIAKGMDPEAARSEALRRFGDVDVIRGILAPNRTARRRSIVILAVLGLSMVMQRILWTLGFYHALYKAFPFYVPETLKNLLEIGVCLAALLALGERRLGRALAVDRTWPRALAFGVVCTLPMLVGFALARGSNVKDGLAVVYLAFWSPFIEEVVTRGFAFLSLRRLGWPLWPAVTACAMVTGLAHIEKGQSAAAILGLFAFTGIGGAMFCWLLERWGSLWFPWALHALMNFWWEVFNVAPTALGGWYAFVLQNASVLLAILITLKLTKARPSRALQLLADDRLGDRGELHVRRSLVDLAHLRIAPVFLDGVLLRVAVASKQLNG